MQIKNKSNNTLFIKNCNVADTFWKRFLGLMGKKSIDEDSGMLITPCNSIHTFFMKFPIDVVFINKNYEVIYIIEDMKPGKVSKIVKNAYGVVETRAGVLGKCKISIGDTLEMRLPR